MATLDLKAKRFADARDKLRKAIVQQRKALAASPDDPQFQEFMSNH